MHKKIKVDPLKWEPTNRDRQPREPYVIPADIAQENELKTGLTITVNEQPPATQLTTQDTTKHNARDVTGWGP